MRVQARQALLFANAVSAAMSGGDQAQEFVASLRRQITGEPRTRMKAEWGPMFNGVFGPPIRTRG